MKYRVTEVVHYEVEADSEEDAVEAITQDANRDSLCCGVSDRYATPLGPHGDSNVVDCHCPLCDPFESERGY